MHKKECGCCCGIMDFEMKEFELLYGCVNKKMKYESGTLVLSYGWKNIVANCCK